MSHWLLFLAGFWVAVILRQWDEYSRSTVPGDLGIAVLAASALTVLVFIVTGFRVALGW